MANAHPSGMGEGTGADPGMAIAEIRGSRGGERSGILNGHNKRRSKDMSMEISDTQYRAVISRAPNMEPRFWNGEVALFDQVSSPIEGEDHVVRFKGGACQLRLLVSLNERGAVFATYTPRKETAVPLTEIESIHPVQMRMHQSDLPRGEHEEAR